MNEQQSQNLLAKVDPLSIIRKNKLNTQGENLNRNSQVQSFCIEYIVAAFS